MNVSPPHHEVTTVWQNQPVGSHPLSLDEIRSKSLKFQRSIRWRNLREYLASMAVVMYFGYVFWVRDDPLMRLGTAATVAGALYVVYQLHKRGSSRNLPEEPGLSTCLEFHRIELVRQRELLRDVWRWYLLPFFPGFGLIILSVALRVSSIPGGGELLFLVVSGVLLVSFLIAKLNQWAARRLQREIDELDKES